MIRFIKFFHGFLYVRLTGYSPERFLNLCSNKDILIWDLKPVDQGYEFYISIRAFRQLKPLLKKTGTKIHIKKKTGLPFLAFQYRRHKFFFVGIAICFCILFSMSRFVWDVEINGNSYFSDQVLTTYLDTLGIGYGTLKGKLDCALIEEQIRKDYPDIIWVSVRVQGTRLIIDLQEVSAGEETEVQEESGQDLLAPFDGTVTSIVTRSGTPVVEQGAEVKEGDILVSGCVEILDDSGEVANYKYVKADAEIWIAGTLDYEDQFDRQVTVYQKTDRQKKRVIFWLNDRYLELGPGRNRFEEYEISTRQFPLMLGKNFYLPVDMQITTVQELKKEVRDRTKEEIKSQAENTLALYCKKLTKNGFQIQGKNVKIKFNEKQVQVDGTIDVLVQAQDYQPTEKRTLEPKEGQEINGINTGTNGDST